MFIVLDAEGSGAELAGTTECLLLLCPGMGGDKNAGFQVRNL